MSDVVISKKHYDEILADRDRLQRERDALAEALLSMAHADGCWCEASFAMPGTTVGHTQECEAAKEALALRDDGFPP